MPQKTSRKNQKQTSPKKNPKNDSTKVSKTKQTRRKKVCSPLRSKPENRLYQSVGVIPFQNKKINHLLSQKSQKKSSTQRELSTGIFQDVRPNKQYYGQEPSLYVDNKCHSASNVPFYHRTSKTKHPKNAETLCKILRSYRSLQAKHCQQVSQNTSSLSSSELHRLRRIQQCELRRQMQKLVEMEWKIVCQR